MYDKHRDSLRGIHGIKDKVHEAEAKASERGQQGKKRADEEFTKIRNDVRKGSPKAKDRDEEETGRAKHSVLGHERKW